MQKIVRLDKFLKVTRLAKRRTEAKEALEAHRIECFGRPVKASHRVKAGDELLIHYAGHDIEVKVLDVPERLGPKTKPETLYSIVSERPTATKR